MRTLGCVAFLLCSLPPVLLGACGDDPEVAPDAGDSPDATTSGPVTVIATQRTPTPGLPQANVRVFASYPDGGTSPVALTDATGTAVLDDVPPGSSVTVIYDEQEPPRSTVTTFLTVEPGDLLRVGSPTAPDWTPLGTMTVELPSVEGATSYVVRHGCGTEHPGPALTATVNRFDHCNTGTMDVLLESLAVSEITHWALAEDVPFADGTTYVHPGPWTPVGSFDVDASGFGPDADELFVSLGPRLNGGRRIEQWVRRFTLVDGAISTTAPWTTGGEGVYAAFAARFADGDHVGRIAILPDTTTSIAITPPAIPALSSMAVDAETRELTWVETGEGTYDVLVAHLGWRAAGPDGAPRAYAWRVIAPRGDLARVRLPELPPGIELAADVTVAGFVLDWEERDWSFVKQLPEWALATPLADDASHDDGPVNFYEANEE